MKLPFSLQASRTEEREPSTSIAETRSSRDPSTPNLDIENSRCTRHLPPQWARYLKFQDPFTPESILKFQCETISGNCACHCNTRNWSSRDHTTPKTDVQSSRCPKHLPPQSRVFDAPGSFHPRLDIEASVSKPLITCELHHLPQYKELEFQRSFHPTMLQMYINSLVCIKQR